MLPNLGDNPFDLIKYIYGDSLHKGIMRIKFDSGEHGLGILEGVIIGIHPYGDEICIKADGEKKQIWWITSNDIVDWAII